MSEALLMIANGPQKLLNRADGRFGAAVLAALAIHGVLLLLLLGSARGAIITGGDDVGETATPVMLVSLAGLRGAPSPPPPAAALEAVFRKLQAQEAKVSVAANDKSSQKVEAKTSLDTLIDKVARDDHQSAGENGQSASDDHGAGAAQVSGEKKVLDRKKDAASHAGVGTNAPSSGDLWGQIEPCWRKLPGSSDVSVSLEVAIDDRGRVAIPPKIFRATTGAANEQRLAAEARALAAVAACVPFHGSVPLGGRQVFKVDFAASR